MDLDLDPHSEKLLYPDLDPHKNNADPQPFIPIYVQYILYVPVAVLSQDCGYYGLFLTRILPNNKGKNIPEDEKITGIFCKLIKN